MFRDAAWMPWPCESTLRLLPFATALELLARVDRIPFIGLSFVDLQAESGRCGSVRVVAVLA